MRMERELEKRVKKAYERLKEFEMFSDDFATFQNLFYDHLKHDKKDEAIELLLMAIFSMLKSHGEKFNRLLELLSEEKKMQLLNWLETTLREVQNDTKTDSF